MTAHRKSQISFRHFLLVAAVAAAVAAPAAGAANRPFVQIGGQLVAPSELSAWQAQAGRASSSGAQRVQIGGRLVAPSELSSWQAKAGPDNSAAAVSAARFGTGDSGFSWSDAGIGVIVGIGATLLLLAAVVARRRTHPSTT